MAHTATATQGFEPLRLTSGEEIFYLPGDPGVTFTKGDAVIMTNGVLVLATDSAADVVGTVMRTTVCPAASQAAVLPYKHDPIGWGAADKCLIPIKFAVPGGVQVYKATFKNHHDDTLAAYTAGTPSVTLTVSPGANDDGNGGIIYVYEGPGMGEVLISADFVHSGIVCTVHRVANTTLTASSKILYLEGAGSAAVGVSFMGRIDQSDEDELDCADGTDDGDWVVFMDWLSAPEYLSNLTLPVIRRSAIYSA